MLIACGIWELLFLQHGGIGMSADLYSCSFVWLGPLILPFMQLPHQRRSRWCGWTQTEGMIYWLDLCKCIFHLGSSTLGVWFMTDTTTQDTREHYIPANTPSLWDFLFKLRQCRWMWNRVKQLWDQVRQGKCWRWGREKGQTMARSPLGSGSKR